MLEWQRIKKSSNKMSDQVDNSKSNIEEIISNLEKTKDSHRAAKNKLNDWSVEIDSQEEAAGAHQDLWQNLKQVGGIPKEVTNSGVNMSREMLKQSQQISGYVSNDQIDDCISTAGTITDSMGGIVSSGATISYPQNQLPQAYHRVDSIMSQRTNQEETHDRLRIIDVSLADTYDSAWKSLGTTIKDKTRGPMFLMREVITRLYQNFAPDNKVKEYYSNNEQVTEEIKKDRIKRNHRIEYISSIINPWKKGVFLAEEDSFLKIYGRLSKAHTHGSLDQGETSGLLYQADALIRLLLDSLMRDKLSI